jgi:hypothetical protein
MLMRNLMDQGFRGMGITTSKVNQSESCCLSFVRGQVERASDIHSSRGELAFVLRFDTDRRLGAELLFDGVAFSAKIEQYVVRFNICGTSLYH